jgi:hypothetical protein
MNRVEPFTMAAIAEAGVAVKSGADQTRVGCSRTGQPGNGALTDHVGAGERVASYSGGLAPPEPPQASDQGVCPPFSIVAGGKEKRGHQPRKKRECGTTRLGHSRSDPSLWVVYWVPCGTLGCDYCGPRVRAQKARAYIEKIGTTRLVKRMVADTAFPAVSRKLRRSGVDYLQVPAPDDQRAFLLAEGVGEAVADTEAEVLALIAAFPAGTGRNISASQAWQPAAVKVERAEEPDGYDFKAFVRAGIEHARQVAAELGLLVGDVAGRDGDAFLIRQPDDPLAWRRFCRWAGVEEPGKRRLGKRKRVAA